MPPTSITSLLDRLRADPTDHDLHDRLGDLYASADPRRAVGAYLRSARLLVGGNRLDRARRASRAADILAKALPLAADPTTVELHLAELLEVAARAAEAEPIYRRLAGRAAFADRPLAQLALFERLATLAPLDLDHRRRTADALVGVGLTDVAAHELAAVAAIELGALRPREAVATIEHAFALAPRAPELHELRARILGETSRDAAAEAWDLTARAWREARGAAAQRPRGSILLQVDEPFLRERLNALAVRLGLTAAASAAASAIDGIRIAVVEQAGRGDAPGDRIAELRGRVPGLPIVLVRRGGPLTAPEEREFERLGVTVWTPARPLLDLAALVIGAAAAGRPPDHAADVLPLGAELDTLRDRLAEAHAEAARTRTLVTATHDQLTSQLTAHQEHLVETRAALAARTAEARRADERSLALAADLATRDAEIGPLRARQAFAETHARDLETELRAITAKRDSLTADRDRLTGERARVCAERDRATADSDRVAAERDRVIADRDRIASERNQVTAERDRVIAERDRLTTTGRDLEAERVHLANELGEARDDAQQRRDELARAHQRLRQEQAAATAAAAAHDQLVAVDRAAAETVRGRLAERVAMLAARLVRERGRRQLAEEAGRGHGNLRRRLAELRNRGMVAHQGFTGRLHAIGRELSDVRGERDQLGGRLAAVQREAEVLRERAASGEVSAAEVLRLRQLLSSAQGRFVDLAADSDERRLELERLRTEHAEAERTLVQTRDLLRASTATNLTAQADLDRVARERDDFAAATETEQRRSLELRQALTAQADANDAVRVALTTVEVERAHLETERARLQIERDSLEVTAETERLTGLELRQALAAKALESDGITAELEALQLRTDGLLREVERWRNDAAPIRAGRRLSAGWLAALVVGITLTAAGLVGRWLGPDPEASPTSAIVGEVDPAPRRRSIGRQTRPAAPTAIAEPAEIRFYTLGEYAESERELIRRADRTGYSARAKLRTRGETQAYYGYQATVLGWDLSRLTRAVQSPSGELRSSFRFAERTYIDIAIENLGLDASFDINTIASSFTLRVGERVARARVSRDERPTLLPSTTGETRVESISMRLEFPIPTTDAAVTLEFRPPDGEPSTFLWEQP